MNSTKTTQGYEEAGFFAGLIRAHLAAKPLMTEIAPYVKEAQGFAQMLSYSSRLAKDLGSGQDMDDYDKMARCIEVLCEIATGYHHAARALIEIAETTAEVRDE